MIIFLLLCIFIILFSKSFSESFLSHTYELKDNFKLCKRGHEIKSATECTNAAHLLKLNPAGPIQRSNNTPPGCSFNSLIKHNNLFWNSSLNGESKYNIAPICNKWGDLEEPPTILQHLEHINTELNQMKEKKKIPKLPIQFNIKTNYTIKNKNLKNSKEIFF